MILAHDVTGDGPPVVLLHSTACDRRMWDPQIPALVAAGYRAVRCDLRGFGDSLVPDGPYNDADDVVDLLAALGIGPAAVVGASGGGRVAIELAARRPAMVTALALLCTAVAGHRPGAALAAYQARETALVDAGDVAAAVELNVDTWLGPEAGATARDQVRTMQRRAFEVQLAAGEEPPERRVDHRAADITAPTLLVSGAHDLVDFRDIAARLAAEIPHARHVELDWAGHLPGLERPAEINRLLVDFLAGGR